MFDKPLIFLQGGWATLSLWSLSTLRVIGILLVAWLVIWLVRRTILSFHRRVLARLSDPESIQRAETLARVFRHFATVALSLMAGMLVLAELGISLAPILGAAGVVGLAVGFGAQSLVKDFFSGFFLLLEDQLRQGDIVKLGELSGTVEVITLRHVRLRDAEGSIHFIPNGSISTVTNHSRGFARALIEISVANRESPDQVMRVMRDVAETLRQDPDFGSRILDPLEMLGIERLDSTAVVIRARFRVAPLQQWTVRREYLRRAKQAFDTLGIEISFPQMTAMLGEPSSPSRPSP